MKKILSIALTLCLVFTMSFASLAETPEAGKVRVSNQTITVNGEVIPMDVYNIDGYNYFKLRDIAYILSGTESQFSVSYDEETKSIIANSGEPYIVAGGEMTLGKDNSKKCRPSTQTAVFNGEVSEAYTYNIGGNNYFKLRDLGDEFGFIVDYDESTRSVIINSTDYEEGTDYISVTCTSLADRLAYVAYGYLFDYTGIDHVEVISAKLNGKTIEHQALTESDLDYVESQLSVRYDCGAYYYVNADRLRDGTYTLDVDMILYHTGGHTGEVISISHTFDVPTRGDGVL